jgi:hypothetical protein
MLDASLAQGKESTAREVVLRVERATRGNSEFTTCALMKLDGSSNQSDYCRFAALRPQDTNSSRSRVDKNCCCQGKSGRDTLRRTGGGGVSINLFSAVDPAAPVEMQGCHGKVPDLGA